jgi:hypothetical protein
VKLVVFIAVTTVACAAPQQAPTARVPIEDHTPVEGVDIPCTRPATQTPPGEWVDPIRANPVGVDPEPMKPAQPAPNDDRVDCTGTTF